MSGDQQPFRSSINLNQRLDVDFALQAAGLGIWEVEPTTNLVIWDDQCRQLFGLAKDNQLPYEQAIQYVHPDDIHRVDAAVQSAMSSRSGGLYDATYRTLGGDDGVLRWVRFQGRAYFNEAGELSRFGGIAQEVTEQILAQQKIEQRTQDLGTANEELAAINKELLTSNEEARLARQQLEESESRFRSLIEQSPIATCLFVGREQRIEVANKAMIEVWGKGPGVLGMPLADALPELRNQHFLATIDTVLTTGEPHSTKGGRADLVIDGRLQTFYFDYDFKALHNAAGDIYAVLEVATDVTREVLAQQKIDESQQQVLNLFEQSPVGLATIKGDDLIFRTANPFYGYLVGRSPDQLVDKPLLEALPELAGQGFDDLLRRVIATGVPFIANEIAVVLLRNQQLETSYVNLTYQPLREGGHTTGVFVVATDVTQQVTSRQKVEESEAKLRSVVESAPFPIGVYVGPNLMIQLANRSIMDVWGKGYDVVGKSYREILPELTNQPIFSQIEQVQETGIPFHARHQQVDIVIDGRLQPFFFNYSFTPLFNASGQVYGVMNTAAEVTDLITTQQELLASEARYRSLSQELDQQIQERTEELVSANQQLAATNGELEASNEEYAALNEELEEANGLLIRSNENLQTFAYVASHDLQEPLRKIQQFGDLLRAQYGSQMGDGLDYLERMQSAASRMSTLIKDLLTFSRISTRRDTNIPIALNEVVTKVLADLELPIQESGAQIRVANLPTVSGDASQLGQLFQNLLSNALKFRREGVVPRITIDSSTVGVSSLPPLVKPTRQARQYYRIEVTDNGIGFDEKYLDRIFQVFQRLHGRNQFPGTGIGLSICEKVVTNHGGAITATSQEGQGSTFSVYLPA